MINLIKLSVYDLMKYVILLKLNSYGIEGLELSLLSSDKHQRKLRLIIINTCLRLKNAKPASDERPEQDGLEKCSYDL